jgi:hypothetical protein
MPVVNQKKIVSLAQARKNLEGKGIKITGPSYPVCTLCTGTGPPTSKGPPNIMVKKFYIQYS